jgi:1-deoxy-D-xylulose 5-phosphate reductoisomerase
MLEGFCTWNVKGHQRYVGGTDGHNSHVVHVKIYPLLMSLTVTDVEPKRFDVQLHTIGTLYLLRSRHWCQQRKVQVMTRAEALQKEYEELTDKQATVIKDRDALTQVCPRQTHTVVLAAVDGGSS